MIVKRLMILCALVAALGTAVPAGAGTVAGELQANQSSADKMLGKITSAASEMKTMRCDFVQVRKMSLLADEIKSSGVMYFEKPSRLRWEYREPTPYVLTINGGTVTVDSEAGRTVSDASSSRLYKGIADMVMDCMSGETLRDSKMFRTTFTDLGSLWVAELKPVRKDLQRMFSSLVLNFDPATGLLRSMVMNDPAGNSTSITVSNISVNGNYGIEW
jgi:outer membrane lipoprotein carrier protein